MFRFRVWIVTVIFTAMLACKKTGNKIGIVADITNPIVTMFARFGGTVRASVILRFTGVK